MRRGFALRVLLVASMIFLNSCGIKKNGAFKHQLMAEGTVTISSKSGECALWIMSDHTPDFAGFYPVNLDEQFRKNNLKIAFNFNDSRAPLPEGCNNLKAIVISEVKILK
jgi:hypothetical protein